MFTLVAVGADPEFFTRHAQTNHPVPICGLLGGTKDKPIKIFPNDDYSGIQEDNVMVEFNIMPARSATEFSNNIMLVMDYLRDALKDRQLVMDITPSMSFKDLSHPQAQDIGCMGDFNAWTFKDNPRLSAEKLGVIRTAGGHVHVSFLGHTGEPTPREKIELVRALDLTLGVPSVLVDTDFIRRKYYGIPGAFRDKSYGIEYRTLSNFWIQKPKWMEWVFNQVQETINRLSSDGEIYKTTKDELEVQQIIASGNRRLAEGLIHKYQLNTPVN